VTIADWLQGWRAARDPAVRERLAAWRARPPAEKARPAGEDGFVVVDVESTGLNVWSDRLIAIGAVRLDRLRIPLAGSFYRVLRQPQASAHDNILVHGIGGTAQVEGVEPADALLDFLDFAGRSVLVGFHAQFDHIMLRKAMRRHLGLRFAPQWLDLAVLAPALARPEGGAGSVAQGLDDWLADAGITNFRRHDALADALATAQLLQVLLQRHPEAAQGRTADLFALARAQDWLARQGR